MVVIAGRRRVPHRGVADEQQVGLQRLGVFGEERRQRRRAGLLLALEQHADVAGQAAVLVEGAARLDEGHQLALVVGGAARDDALAARRPPPAAARTAASSTAPADRPAARRNGRRTARAARRGSSPWRRPSPSAARRVDPGRLEADVGEFADQPVGGAVAIGEMRGRGRDRGDFEQVEQPVERGPWLASMVESTSSSMGMTFRPSAIGRSPERRPPL